MRTNHIGWAEAVPEALLLYRTFPYLFCGQFVE